MRDLRGMVFGKLTAIEPTEKRTKNGSIIWLCDCSCGETTEPTESNLVSGNTTSCGCNRPGVSVGQKYGELTVLNKTSNNGQSVWLCQCSCGKTKEVNGSYLNTGSTGSCGCRRPGVSVGQIYGELVPIETTGSKNGKMIWLCQCSCGRKAEVNANNLVSGNTVSCGCKNRFDYGDLRFRSKWEAYWWIATQCRGVQAEYEQHTLDVFVDGKTLHYTPDFWVPDESEFVEIKGRLREMNMKKFHQALHDGHQIKLVQKEQLEDWCECKVHALNKAYLKGGFDAVKDVIESKLR
jgi:hypothetical protein